MALPTHRPPAFSYAQEHTSIKVPSHGVHVRVLNLIMLKCGRHNICTHTHNARNVCYALSYPLVCGGRGGGGICAISEYVYATSGKYGSRHHKTVPHIIERYTTADYMCMGHAHVGMVHTYTNCALRKHVFAVDRRATAATPWQQAVAPPPGCITCMGSCRVGN